MGQSNYKEELQMELKEFIDQVQNELPGHFSEKLKNADVSTAEVDKL